MKYWPSLIILLAGIGAAIATFVSTKRDSEQNDNIEKFADENLALTKQIDTLQKLNYKIEQSTNLLSEQNKKSIAENIELTNRTKLLISEVQDLSTKINERAIEDYEENRTSGIFEFNFDLPINKLEDVTVKIGMQSTYGSNRWPPLVDQNQIFGPPPILEWKVENNEFYLDINLIDLKTGEFLLVSKNNNWQAHSRFRKLINYDNKGFEIIDEKNDVVFNFNISQNNVLNIQFIFLREDGINIAYGQGFGESFSSTKGYNSRYRNAVQRMSKYFYHEGPNWLHKRLPGKN